MQFLLIVAKNISHNHAAHCTYYLNCNQTRKTSRTPTTKRQSMHCVETELIASLGSCQFFLHVPYEVVVVISQIRPVCVASSWLFAAKSRTYIIIADRSAFSSLDRVMAAILEPAIPLSSERPKQLWAVSGLPRTWLIIGQIYRYWICTGRSCTGLDGARHGRLIGSWRFRIYGDRLLIWSGIDGNGVLASLLHSSISGESRRRRRAPVSCWRRNGDSLLRLELEKETVVGYGQITKPIPPLLRFSPVYLCLFSILGRCAPKTAILLMEQFVFGLACRFVHRSV